MLRASEVENFSTEKPEQHLMVAMIRRAINDLAHPKERNAAYEWIFKNQGDDILSFELCCENLGWEPNQLRKQIRFQLIHYCKTKFSV